jgi:hypothetical protein
MWDFPATRRGDIRVPVGLSCNKERGHYGSSGTFLQQEEGLKGSSGTFLQQRKGAPGLEQQLWSPIFMWDFPATRRGDFRVPVGLSCNKERGL